MLLPLALALVTAMALIVVIGPLMRAVRAPPDRLEFDRAVYRDQLEELERDRARDLIGAAEAETARLEIERRMLVADRADVTGPREARALPYGAALLALVLAGGAGALYLALGSPGVPDQPHDARVAAAQGEPSADLDQSAADLERQLAAKPDDVEGWAQLARTEAQLEDWPKSADAYRHAVALAPDRADIGAAYGEVLVLGADGIVTPAASDAFRAVLARDAKNGMARYYLALADAQAGKTDAAIAAWQALAAESPADAPVRAELKSRIDEAAQAAGIKPPPLAPAAAASAASAPSPAPGPDAAQMAAAADMSPEARQAMIRTMVEQLATRLQSAPGDLDGWTRLAKAYAVLGERDKAADAYAHAATLDPKNPELPLGEIDALLSDKALDQPIPDKVLALLNTVETLAPEEPEALWYLGLAAAQAKKPDAAAGYWQRLLAALPADAPERATVTQALATLKK
jgi:cytochrome c-type biogenesis protein CcmH